jgi:hypothetical protein
MILLGEECGCRDQESEVMVSFEESLGLIRLCITITYLFKYVRVL